MFTLQTSFKSLLLKVGGGGGSPLVEVTVNSKEENFSLPNTSKNSASGRIPAGHTNHENRQKCR